MDAEAAEVGEKIRTEKALSKETEAKLRQAIERFTQGFIARRKQATPPPAQQSAQGSAQTAASQRTAPQSAAPQSAAPKPGSGANKPQPAAV